jgi:hypothetical protein
MKQGQCSGIPTALALLLSGYCSIGSDQIVLEFKQSGLQGEVGLRSQLALPVSAMYPEYTILSSTNLVNWEAVGGPISGSVGVSDEFLRRAVPLAGNQAFYRVVANVKLAPAESRIGDAIYGYGTEFSRQLQLLGQLPLSDFVSLYTPTNDYLPQISFDPTTAEFWDLFNLDPAVHNATNSVDPRLTDYRLNTNEFAVFQTNGFVVSSRLGSYSFADAFYKIYSDDLPVFFSADAALQAWHRSYVSMLEEVEETYLSPWFQFILESMATPIILGPRKPGPGGGYLPGLWSEAQGTALADGVLDADYFLAVAQSLLAGTNNYGYLGQTAQIQSTLTAISNLQPATIVMFGTNRVVDFSQFQVRGHYEASQRLQRYFRAMMWCGLIDFRFSGFEFTFPEPVENSLRELSGAVALNMLLTRSGQFDTWLQLDNVVQMFVGAPDSMNFAQLSDLLAAAGVFSPTNLPNTAALTNLQGRIMSGQLGVQNIRSGYFWSPWSPEQIKLPRSFTVLGQRFVPDAWAHSMCVFDSIIWDEDGIPGVEDKVLRRVPSALDIAFSVFGNNQVVPDLVERISRTYLTPADGRAYWRDGRKYQHNLAAARNVVDSQGPDAWTNNIYSSWLACLRELSEPTTDAQYPQAMRTRAWAMKTLNTQLASWTQLRHDTVLYVKQPYTGLIVCSYPAGYVEPRPRFWQKMKEMALRAKALVSTLPATMPNGPSDFVFEPNIGDFNQQPFTVSLHSIWTNRMQFFDSFASTMATLEGIAEKELARATLATNEVAFLQNLVEDQSISYVGEKTYSGWYPKLFYNSEREKRSTRTSPSDIWDALVTDVHTDPQDAYVGDPGSILHEGVGNVHLLMIAVDCGPRGTAVYAGPVLSHYEFELGPTTRQTDSQWKSEVRAGNLPPQPDWTRGYLVPGAYSVPQGVQ